jgi:hypothetical protein
MCAGAIYWSGCGHVVYALPEDALRALAGEPTFSLPCREVFARGSLQVVVEGPFLVEDAKKVHAGFWTEHVNGPRRGEEGEGKGSWREYKKVAIKKQRSVYGILICFGFVHTLFSFPLLCHTKSLLLPLLFT